MSVTNPVRVCVSGKAKASLGALTIPIPVIPFVVLLLNLALTGFAASPEPAPPSTPRDFFNVGVQQLRAGKLREAEASLESAVASQNERLQDPALYNLGHVRFDQGV